MMRPSAGVRRAEVRAAIVSVYQPAAVTLVNQTVGLLGDHMEQLVAGLLTLLALAPLIAFWFWMFSDLMSNDYPLSTSKTNWMLAFLLLNVLAAAMYYL